MTLFLTGVFPDYATTRALGPLDPSPLLRAARLPSSQQERLAGTPAMDLWEYLEARRYRGAPTPAPAATARVLVAVRWPTGSGRPGACSTTSPTSTCSGRTGPGLNSRAPTTGASASPPAPVRGRAGRSWGRGGRAPVR